MPVPPVGTAVSVLYSGLGYPQAAPGQILATIDTWTEDAAGDMPPVIDADHAHVLVTAVSAGSATSEALFNATIGDGIDQFTVA